MKNYNQLFTVNSNKILKMIGNKDQKGSQIPLMRSVKSIQIDLKNSNR